MISVHTVSIRAAARSSLDRWCSAAERERSLRYVQPDDQLRCLAAAALRRTVLADLLRVAPEALRFTASSHGRPALAWPANALDFNCAHGGDLVGLAVAMERQVGLDIEPLTSAVRVAEVAGTVFTGAERASAADDAGTLLEWWVRKEAVLKMLGTGLATPPLAIEVHRDAPRWSDGRPLPALVQVREIAGHLLAVAGSPPATDFVLADALERLSG